MIHQLFSHRFYWLKADRKLYEVSQSVKFFFLSSCAKFHFQTSGCTEGLKQVHRHCFVLLSGQIPLIFVFHFAFTRNNLTMVPIYSCAVVRH